MKALSRIPLAVFRADASPESGGGHIIRCLSLADGLAAAGWQCSFAVRPGTMETIPKLKEFVHTIYVLDCAPEGEPAALASEWPSGCALMIVDHYGRDASFEGACRSWAGRILAIDDLADRAHDSDLLLDQTLGRRPEDYSRHVPQRCRMLLGPEYALLRAQFSMSRGRALSRREEGGSIRRILVSLGATDQDDVNSLALAGIACSGVEAEVDILVGPQFSNLEKIRNLAMEIPQKVNLLTDVTDMADLMVAADIAIGAAGTSTWERCCLGLPSIVIVRGESQLVQAKFVREKNLAHVIGWFENVTETDIASAIKYLSDDSSRCLEMSRTASAVCDGRGIQRVVKEVEMLCAGSGSRAGEHTAVRPS